MISELLRDTNLMASSLREAENKKASFDQILAMSGRERLALTDQTVTQLTTREFDVLSLLRGLSSADQYTNLPQRELNQMGVYAFDKFEAYFKANPFVTKVLVPERKDERNDIKEVARILNLAQKWDHITKTNRYPSIKKVIKGIFTQLEDQERITGSSNIPNSIIRIYAGNRDTTDAFTHESNSYNKIHSFLHESINPNDAVKRVNRPQEIVNHLQSVSQEIDYRNLPDIYTLKCGGVSLKDLSAINNPRLFIRKSMQYLQNLPPGDYNTQGLMEHIFFTLPGSVQDIAAVDADQVSLFSKNIYSFQWYLTQKLFSPLFVNDVDSQFDRQMGRIIEHLSPLVLRQVGLMLYPTLFNMKDMEKVLLEGYAEYVPKDLYTAIFTTFGIKSWQRDPAVFDYLALTNFYLQKDVIRTNWEDRLGKTRSTEAMSAGFEELINVDRTVKIFQDSFQSYFITHMPADASQVSLDLLLQDELDPSGQIIPMKGDFPVEHRYQFPEGSPVDKLNFSSISFYEKESETGNVPFILRTQNINIGLLGQLNPVTRDVELVLELPDLHPWPETFVDIVKKSFSVMQFQEVITEPEKSQMKITPTLANEIFKRLEEGK